MRLQFDGNQVPDALRPEFHFFRINRAPEALDVTERTEGQPVQCVAAQPVDLRGIFMGGFAMVRRDYPFGEVVIFGKIFPVRGCQFASIPELVQHPFMRRAVPHLFLALDPGVKSMRR